MTLDELEGFCKKAKKAGVKGSTPVCVLGDSGDQGCPEEIIDFDAHLGQFKDDPGLKLRSPVMKEGVFIMLSSCSSDA
ncbi:hypothetical protein [Idiomarina abyssalis]|uniref:Uncharacterized protein n=1 Tax=Idiomarina abyssalis TaxID=86102 RepID=A0A8I1GF54_9GAMM|nr:hypothetical protein [Idiomarina abyssalis]MBJ7265423.1 hypothetical protein [Idiomarina abyssalis]MBJ7316903.1 hypothetical protein [Idiomarina abyssalis]